MATRALLLQLPKPAQGSASSMSVAEAMEAVFLPALDEDQADMFTQSELRLYRHAEDHRLLTRDIPVYSRFGDILGQPLISKVIPFSGGQWRFKEESRPAAAARQPGGEMNEPYGMNTSEGISQDNLVLNFYPDLSESYPGLCKSGFSSCIPTYPGICKSRNLILTYPGLSQSTKLLLGYPGLS